MRGLGIDAEDALDPAMVRFVTRPAEMIDSDLVVLPGSRAAVSDLMWLRERGFAEALASQDDRALYVALGRHPVSGLVRTVQAR